MDIGRIWILGIATILVLFWITLAEKYEGTYAALVNSIDPEQYKYPELFCIGFALMKFLKIDSKSKNTRKDRKSVV